MTVSMDADVSQAARLTPASARAGLRRWLAERAQELDGFRHAPHRDLAGDVARLRPFHRLLWEHGWARLGWPQDAGGLGGAAALRGVVYDEVLDAGYDLPRGFEFLEIIAPTLLRFSPELGRVHVPLMLRGDVLLCQGFSEPEAGSDLAGLRTHAQRTQGGFVLRGQKTWIGNGHVADWCLLLARTGPPDSRHRGLTMFWMDMTAPGITTRPIVLANGRDELAELFLDDVVVPETHVVGGIDQGWAVAMYLLQFERGTWAWQRQCWLRARLAGLVGAQSPAATGGATEPADAADAAGAVGEAWLELVSLRALAHQALTALSEGRELDATTSIVKVMMSRAEQAVFEAGRALTWPAVEMTGTGPDDLAGEWFHGLATSVYGGAVDVQRDIIAQQLLGMPRQ
jgi:acyl-CoA dehydrogenase